MGRSKQGIAKQNRQVDLAYSDSQIIITRKAKCFWIFVLERFGVEKRLNEKEGSERKNQIIDIVT